MTGKRTCPPDWLVSTSSERAGSCLGAAAPAPLHSRVGNQALADLAPVRPSGPLDQLWTYVACAVMNRGWPLRADLHSTHRHIIRLVRRGAMSANSATHSAAPALQQACQSSGLKALDLGQQAGDHGQAKQSQASIKPDREAGAVKPQVSLSPAAGHKGMGAGVGF